MLQNRNPDPIFPAVNQAVTELRPGNKDFGGLSPRDYLRDKDWDEQMRVGLDLLRDRKVLK
jgi:hypothetical protein